MMRLKPTAAQRKASRKALSQQSTGFFALMRVFTRFQLFLASISLVASVALLFLGTFVYFNANRPNVDPKWSSFYDSVLQFYGIENSEFSMLHQTSDAFGNSRLHNYQISMLFVAVISILIEVGLICSIIFEHFKLSLFYNILMISGLIYGLWIRQTHIYAHSLAYQVFFLTCFCFFSVGIKYKSQVAKRALTKGDLELRNSFHCAAKV